MSSGVNTASRSEKGKSGKSRLRWYLIGGLVLLVVGVAAGAGLWRMQNPTVDATKEITAMSPDSGQALLPIGRITVNVAATAGFGEKRSRFLVIEPTLLYSAAYDESGKAKMVDNSAALRDSFIEFLSQLHEDDIYGSAGLAELRQELLRRARLVVNDDAPQAILLQDFVLQ